MPDVTLEPCGTERAETIQNLFQFYVHDFSDFWETRRTELQEDGRFGLYPPLPRYWTDPSCSSFLIRADGNLAGFILLDREGHSGRPCDFNVGEFFVARHYRREGVGRRAALAAIQPRSGWWEIAVARRNVGAQAFWRGVAAELAAGPVEETDQNDERWNGLILRVKVEGP
jgi:predicted acetyltransferase